MPFEINSKDFLRIMTYFILFWSCFVTICSKWEFNQKPFCDNCGGLRRRETWRRFIVFESFVSLPLWRFGWMEVNIVQRIARIRSVVRLFRNSCVCVCEDSKCAEPVASSIASFYYSLAGGFQMGNECPSLSPGDRRYGRKDLKKKKKLWGVYSLWLNGSWSFNSGHLFKGVC